MPSDYDRLRDSLRVLRDVLPPLVASTCAGNQLTRPGAWHDRLRRNVLPSLDFDLPVLLVAVCGGGSTGKSTLVNMLAGRRVAQVGFRAGLTRRVLLVGHPQVLGGGGVAESLLYRLGDSPVPWEDPRDCEKPGPPLYALSEALPPNLLLIDTPDFDTGQGGRLVNRDLADPILRTADVILYVFTNVVYNNLSNSRFMSEVVGGIGGRPTVLVYRISRAASDEEVLEHCRAVGSNLFGQSVEGDEFPEQIVGVYRMHESDAVVLGEAQPALIPLYPDGAGRPLGGLLSSLDVAKIKRHVFRSDLAKIVDGARTARRDALQAAWGARLYREGVERAMAESALDALSVFPVQEAVSVATRLFLDTSPPLVKWLRGTGHLVAAPARGVQSLFRAAGRWTGLLDREQELEDPRESLAHSLLVSANRLRNRLMDESLILRVSHDDGLLTIVERATSQGAGPGVLPDREPLDGRTLNLHFAVPEAVRRREEDILAQDWEHVTARLRDTVPDLIGIPEGITEDLRTSVREFRGHMRWTERLREVLFASLTALPPLLGVTYTLLTADPISGTGLWIRLESIFGLNDLWALVSIPASAGLGEQERKQLEALITPVFNVWLGQRVSVIVDVFGETVCGPIGEALSEVPVPKDPRFAEVASALAALGEPT